MSFHADILGEQINRDVEPDSPQAMDKSKETYVIKKKPEPIENKDMDIASLENFLESAVEPTGIIENSPWTMAMDKYLKSEETVDLDSILGNVLSDQNLKKNHEPQAFISSGK